MIKQPIAFPAGQPLNRTSAAQLVQIANRYDCRVMIEHNQKLVNAKSMLGLLSLSVEEQADMMLVADGAEEDVAVAAIVEWLNK
ncbi:MAG: HPr family phosphocarrier protein [Clostridia bacterium]|nr:HPr family phosphocarrier protein [Clostridia bacterium]